MRILLPPFEMNDIVLFWSGRHECKFGFRRVSVAHFCVVITFDVMSMVDVNGVNLKHSFIIIVLCVDAQSDLHHQNTFTSGNRGSHTC